MTYASWELNPQVRGAVDASRAPGMLPRNVAVPEILAALMGVLRGLEHNPRVCFVVLRLRPVFMQKVYGLYPTPSEDF